MTVTESEESTKPRDIRSLNPWSGGLLPTGSQWRPSRWIAVGAVLIAAAIHAVVAKDSFAVIFGADEVGNLANSLFFADPNAQFQLSGSGYMPGLGLVLAPIWLVQSDPVVAYRLAIAVVTAIGVACIWPFSRLARQWDASPSAAVIIGSVVSVIPARALHSNNVLAESLFVFTLAWLAVYATVLVQRPSFRNGSTFGLIAGAVWWSHGRSVPIVFVVGVSIVALLFAHRKAALGVIATLVPTGLLGYVAYRAISAQFYPGDARQKDLITQLIDNNLLEIADVAASQLWYVLLAWSILVPVGVIGLLHRASRPLGSDLRLAARWVLVGLAAGFVHVVLLLAGAEPTRLRLDIHVYGRYLDAFTPVAAVIGGAILLRGMTRKLAVILVAYVTVSIVAFHAISVPNIPPGGYWTAVHSYGIVAWMNPANIAADTLDPYGTMSVLGALTALLFIACSALQARLFVLATLLVFATTTVSVDQFKLKEMEAEQRYIPAHATYLRSLPGGFPVAGDVAVEDVLLNYNLLGYYMYPVTFAAWTDGDGATPDSAPLVLSSIDAPHLRDEGAWPLNGSVLGDIMVWVLPGPSRDFLDTYGLVAHPIDTPEDAESLDSP